MVPFVRIGTIGIVAANLCGCMSGRVSSVDVTDRAVIVRDQHYPMIAIVRGSEVDRIASEGVSRMDADARWAVFHGTVAVPRTILTHPERADSARLPWISFDYVLTAVSLEDGRRIPVPHALDEDDWGIYDVIVRGASLFVVVGPRYTAWFDTKPDRYWRKDLPDGDWETVEKSDWDKAKHAAISRVARPTEAPPWSISVGAHGTLWVNRDNGVWTTTIVSPDQGTTVVLRGNDLETLNVSAALTNAMPGHWP